MNYRRWTMEVPSGTSSLVIEMQGGSYGGYLYLYIAEGSRVGESSGQYDCYDSGLPSRCLIQNPDAGTWSIMIKHDGYMSSHNYSGVSLSVTGTVPSWASISAGSQFTCGLTTAGDTYCWERNTGGQLGNGTTTNCTTPVLVGGG